MRFEKWFFVKKFGGGRPMDKNMSGLKFEKNAIKIREKNPYMNSLINVQKMKWRDSI